MRETVIDFFRNLPGFEPGKKILCALSGGGDSVALTHLLCSVKRELGTEVGAAHFNHCLRDTADRDEEYSKTLCIELGIPFFPGHGDVARAAGGASIEETARTMRYEFLLETAQTHGYDYIATAHTADDNLETMLLNLVRGSGAKGLSGIPPVRGRIVRPLLAFTGEQLREYLRERGIAYMDDETNFQNICARNALRLEAVPVLRRINPRAAENASGAAERLRRDEEFLEELAAETAAELIIQTPGGAQLDAGTLGKMPEALSSRILRLLCPGCGSGHIKAVLELCRGAAGSGELDLPGLKVRREYGRLIISTPEKPPTIAETPVKIGVTRQPGLEIILEQGKKIYNSEMTFHLKHSNIQGNLRVRSRRTGDRIKLPRRPEKSLKKLLIDEKIPRSERDNLAVLADDAGVVLVERLGTAERCAGDDMTLTIRRR